MGLKFIYVGYTGKGINDFESLQGRLAMHIIKMLAITGGKADHVCGWRQTAKNIYDYLRNNKITEIEAIKSFLCDNISISIGQLDNDSKIKPYELFVLEKFKRKYKDHLFCNDDNLQINTTVVFQKINNSDELVMIE